MNFTEHDLRQIDERYLDSLPEAELREVSKKLCEDLKEAQERLNQNPDNSSRPPSTRAPWEAGKTTDGEEKPVAGKERQEGEQEKPEGPSLEKEKTVPAEGEHPGGKNPNGATEGAAPARQAGKQKGAPGHGRQVELEITEERAHKPGCCAACGRQFDADSEFIAWTGRYESDLEVGEANLPGIQVRHTKHTYYKGVCGCGHETRAEPGCSDSDPEWSVEITEWHLCGPNPVSLIVCLAIHLRVSRKKIQEFLHDRLHIKLSVGVINQCIHEAGRAMEPVVEQQLIPRLLQSPLLHVDETPWKEAAVMLWLWVFVSNTTIVLCIGTRQREVLLNMLGKEFEGILMSDGLGVYRDCPNRLRCRAHLIRKARGLAQSLDAEARNFGEQVLIALYLLMRNIYYLRTGPPQAEIEAIRHHNSVLREMLRALCELYQNHKHDKLRSLAREFLNDREVIFRVVDDPHLPLTNNTAESALRPWVILRKMTFGTRNPQGSAVVALLASVVGTCRLRSLNPWCFLADVLRLRRQGLPPPVMPIPAF